MWRLSRPRQLLALSTVPVYLAVAPLPSFGLSPEQVFEKAAPSIVVIQVFNHRTTSASLGSGVALQSGAVITNCHVLAAGERIRVIDRQTRLSAKLVNADIDRDLCLLHVEGLTARPVELGDLNSVKPGARVYAIGSPRGLELTISDGLVSALRVIQDSKIIQTSAPISSGSSGGGLFDSSGRLIGITTFTLRESQNLNFALPVDWVAQLLSGYSSVSAAIRALAAPVSYRDSFISEDWLTAMSERVASQIPDRSARTEFLKTLHYEAVRAGLDPQLVLALIDALSGFREGTVSPAGARGYMQVMPTWISQVGRPNDDLLHVRTNLRYGCVIFRHYVDRYKGDLIKAVGAYRNQTLGRPEGYPTGTQTFVDEVQRLWRTRWRYDRKRQ